MGRKNCLRFYVAYNHLQKKSGHLQTTILKYRVFKKVFRIDWNLKHSIVVLWVNQAYFHSYFISPGNKLNELELCAINSERYFFRDTL